MNRTEFETRLHNLLDERRDPLDDAACVAFLQAHPEQLASFARLRERLAALPAVAAPRATMRRRLWPWLLGASIAAAALLAVSLWPGRTAHAGSTAPDDSAGTVLAASLQPIPHWLGAAAVTTARQRLLARPDARLEVFTQWSTP